METLLIGLCVVIVMMIGLLSFVAKNIDDL